jgi:hypothetical protein
MQCAGHVCFGEQEIHTELLLENPKGREHLGDLSVDGRSSLKWILLKKGVKM